MLVLVAEDAELLKGELHLLVLADQPPVGQGQETPLSVYDETPVAKWDDCIEGAEDGQVLPQPLEDTSSPDLEQAEEVATPETNVDLDTDQIVNYLNNSELSKFLSTMYE